MQRRLIAGTINVYEPEDRWENIHLDKSDRHLWCEDCEEDHLPDIIADISDLSEVIKDCEFDEIRCWQVLEHLWQDDARKAIQEFRRILKVMGTLDIEVPDIDRIARAWVNGDWTPAELMPIFYGDQVQMPDQDLNAHRYGYTEETLANLLAQNGFGKIQRVDCGNGSLQLRLTALRTS